MEIKDQLLTVESVLRTRGQVEWSEVAETLAAAYARIKVLEAQLEDMRNVSIDNQWNPRLELIADEEYQRAARFDRLYAAALTGLCSRKKPLTTAVLVASTAAAIALEAMGHVLPRRGAKDGV
jgi:hypothetical protein